MDKKIRNFVIIAHIDHGKSTLADRLLELTGTIEKRLMKPQYLDQLDLERERGITIKMAPVRMSYTSDTGQEYELNLIDTPGHSDFGYEVSRALAAVEGAILLVDGTQGIQAQTLANLENAKKAKLKIIGAVNKIDVATSEQIESVIEETSELLDVPETEISRISGKTGDGVRELLDRAVAVFPKPESSFESDTISRGLIFDSKYDEHKGVMVFVRVVQGSYKIGDSVRCVATKTQFKIKEVGQLAPMLTAGEILESGEIGYIATGIKDPNKLKIGDTIIKGEGLIEPLVGYEEPNPVVFVSFYPEDSNEYDNLKKALAQLQLNDAALSFDPDFSEILGRGFKGGFLGRLHFEITAARLENEFNVKTVHSFPSVAYQVKFKNRDWETLTNPKDFPADPEKVKEPMTMIEIVSPQSYLGAILQLKELFRFSNIEVKTFGKKTLISAKLPLADLISDLDDKLKSISEGFASLNYEIVGWEEASVVKMEIRIAEQVVPGLTRIVPKRDAERIGRSTVTRLKELLPRLQFKQAVQAAIGSTIIARETIPAMKKDVTGYLYGGDRTRKMKLWKKQQKGKKRLEERGTKSQVKIPASIFQELLKK